MTAKAAAGFTLRTHKGIERGGGLLPALGAALLAGLGAVWLVKLIVRATSALWHKIKELLIKKEQ